MVRRRKWSRSGRDRINPGHGTQRKVLAAVAIALIVIGLAFVLNGRSISAQAPPFFGDSQAHVEASQKATGQYAIGGFMIVIAIGLLGFALQGTFSRYAAAEHAPVVKDTVGYVVDGTRESVKSVAKAVAEGVRGGEGETVVRCHKCNRDNAADAKFCNACGAGLSKSVPCAGCGELNDPDAKFCDECGAKL